MRERFNMKNIKSSRPQRGIHIFVISKLFRKTAAVWKTHLHQLEQDRDFMRSMYAPLRGAINAEVRKPGLGQRVLERGLESLTRVPNQATIALVSRAAFDLFKSDFLPDLETIEEDFVNGGVGNTRFFFAGHIIEGAFHAKVTTKKREVLFLYFHPSRWDVDQEEAFIELLAIMAEQVYGASRSQVRFIDVREGVVKTPSRSYKRLQKEIAATVEILVKLRKAA